jgi:XTP/dITP diphosphohydrolase
MSPRRFEGDRLVLATHNRGKVDEFAFLLRPRGVQVQSAGELGLEEPEETEDSFAGNALLKARAATLATGLPALADDSGLVVRGLDGAPGIYSARWAGPERDFDLAMRKVVEALAARHGSFAAADKAASFVAVLCLTWPDGHHELFEGRCDGTLAETPRGHNRFGYDPLFVPAGETRTFAEMESEEEHRHSHRGRAVRALLQGCFGIVSP